MDFPDYSGIFKPDSGFDAKGAWQTGFDNRDSNLFGIGDSSGFKDKLGKGLRMAGDVLERWGKNRDSGSGFSGGGISGGGVQSSGDFTVVYPQQQQPYTIEGSKGFGLGDALNSAIGIAGLFL
jgi:hypothetical protein